MSNTETLHFYTEGEPFTSLLRNFISEGRIKAVIEILVEGGLNDTTLIREFILHKLKFEGTTQHGGDLSVVTDSGYEKGTPYQLYWIIQNILSDEEGTIWDRLEYFLDDTFEDENKTALLSLFPKEYIVDQIKYYAIGQYYKVFRTPSDYPEKFGDISDGVILADGTLITCGYQEHNQLYPDLYLFGLVDTKRTLESNVIFHISSGQLSGRYGYKFNDIDSLDEANEFPAVQIQALAEYSKYLRGYYSGTDSLHRSLIKYFNLVWDNGGKFNNLMYLKTYLPEIKLPEFSLEPLYLGNVIRTSPRYSLPGLLNSKFNLDANSITEIEADFDKYKDVVPNNKLNYFYQEFIEGLNGVFNKTFNDFNYDVSSNQADIVKGVKGDVKLTHTQEQQITELANKLYDTFRDGLQVEFVFKGDELYVVQLRFIRDSKYNYQPNFTDKEKAAIVVEGNSHSRGDFKGKLSDVLVIDSDCESERVLTAKALIVRENVNFSHALALSSVLEIPSVYGVGDVELPENIEIHAHSSIGYIFDSTKEGGE